MNRRLLDPFQSVQLPEIIEEYLDHGIATCIAFNRRGTLLAAGTHEGNVVLWDWDTRGVACTLAGHSGPVHGMSWSRNGRYLASVGADAQLLMWNVLQGVQQSEAQEVVALPCAATGVSLSPRSPYKALVSLAQGPPILCDLTTGEQQRLPMLTDVDLGVKPKSADGSAAPQGAVACFSKHGDMILMGHNRAPGLLCVLDTQTLDYLDVIKVPNSARVTGLCLNRKGDLLLANCHDRTLRLYDLSPPLAPPERPPAGGPAPAQAASASHPPPQPLSIEDVRAQLAAQDFKAAKPGSMLGMSLVTPRREFMNAVERCSWSSACFTADSEHIVAAAASKTTHNIYVWSRMNGKMEVILEGPKEGTGPLAWHPLRSCVCSLTWPAGRIFIWARAYAENWSAFAPDFKELDENSEYVEQEDEFDWNTPGATGHLDMLVARELKANAPVAAPAPAAGAQEEQEDEWVDIVSVAPDWVFSSDEDDPPDQPEEERQLHYLPVVITREEEAQPGPAGDKDGISDGDSEGEEEAQDTAYGAQADMGAEPSGQEGQGPSHNDGPGDLDWENGGGDQMAVDGDGGYRRQL